MTDYLQQRADEINGDWTTGDPDTLRCPECGATIWDLPHGHKLAKCWNSEAHASGGTLSFDTMGDD